ncbi:MAG: oligosaccharide flippase family protein [Candidatus Shapirobacteria bacterium]|nr:oligosaccharide flippase family protein [Candidatus Shapirobacteria bacterium]
MPINNFDEEIDIQSVKNRAIKGIVFLSGRMFLLQIVSFIGFFLLTIFLNTAEVGLFFAVSELVAILGYFSDVGLAAALIQHKEKPTDKEIRSTFTIQQILVLSLIFIVLILTPWLKNFYHFDTNGVFLLWSLIFSFFMASLKTIPSVLLERKLRFDLLVVVEIVESFLFYGLAVLLAWKGFGVLSYAWAILVRSIVGVIIIYLLSPWKIGFALEKKSLRHLLRFGVPYQANTFLAVLKDRLMNVFLWKIVGATGVGILGWAQQWAQMPLRFVMDSVMKVTFPAYSRMQEHKEELAKAVEKTLFFLSLTIFPLLVGIGILARPLVFLIPKYAKWEVALLALYLFIINSFFAALTTPLTNALTAIGKIKVVFKLMIMWTVLTWIVYPVLAIKYGYNGVAAAAAIVSASSILALWIAKKYLNFRFFASVAKPVFASLLMGILLWFLTPFLSHTFLGLFALIFSGGLVYFALIYLMVGKSFLEDFKKLFYAFKNR